MSGGLTTSVLNSDGTSPDRSDLFMMLVRAGRRRSLFSKSSDVGSGSASQIFCGFLILVKTGQAMLLYRIQQLQRKQRGCCQDFASFV